tara:strand:+ start:46 stop:486 length:441 start_codon:yes stop_codon:yes gene_type:complete
MQGALFEDKARRIKGMATLKDRVACFQQLHNMDVAQHPHVTKQFLQFYYWCLQRRTQSKDAENEEEEKEEGDAHHAEDDELFELKDIQDMVVVFIPGLYSGHFPGAEDAPDQFKGWLHGMKAVYGIDARYMDTLQVLSWSSVIMIY